MIRRNFRDRVEQRLHIIDRYRRWMTKEITERQHTNQEKKIGGRNKMEKTKQNKNKSWGK